MGKPNSFNRRENVVDTLNLVAGKSCLISSQLLSSKRTHFKYLTQTQTHSHVSANKPREISIALIWRNWRSCLEILCVFKTDRLRCKRLFFLSSSLFMVAVPTSRVESKLSEENKRNNLPSEQEMGCFGADVSLKNNSWEILFHLNGMCLSIWVWVCFHFFGPNNGFKWTKIVSFSRLCLYLQRLR